MNNPTATKTHRRARYGIKAYGRETLFDSKTSFRNYLKEWIAGTDGAERDRATEALANLDAGIPYTDTDIPEETLVPRDGEALWETFRRLGVA